MVVFDTNELVAATKFNKNFSSYIDDAKNLKYKKLWILKNNELDMVIIPWKIYEKIWSYVDEMIEDLEIYNQIKDRLDSKDTDFLDGKEVLKKFDLSI